LKRWIRRSIGKRYSKAACTASNAFGRLMHMPHVPEARAAPRSARSTAQSRQALHRRPRTRERASDRAPQSAQSWPSARERSRLPLFSAHVRSRPRPYLTAPQNS
jgi:hypothetical protein